MEAEARKINEGPRLAQVDVEHLRWQVVHFPCQLSLKPCFALFAYLFEVDFQLVRRVTEVHRLLCNVDKDGLRLQKVGWRPEVAIGHAKMGRRVRWLDASCIVNLGVDALVIFLDEVYEGLRRSCPLSFLATFPLFNLLFVHVSLVWVLVAAS